VTIFHLITKKLLISEEKEEEEEEKEDLEEELRARGGHGLPKVSLGPAMPCPTPCRQAIPETALVVSGVAHP
jgi:hypothetical protein